MIYIKAALLVLAYIGVPGLIVGWFNYWESRDKPQIAAIPLTIVAVGAILLILFMLFIVAVELVGGDSMNVMIYLGLFTPQKY